MTTRSRAGAARFSVVIPCYNQGTFLEECLASVRAQTLPAHEIIVVDDGSTDPYTIERIDALCKPPIILVRQENRGLPGARNAGIARAGGDWILPLDADDQLTPAALATYDRAIAARPEIDIWYPDIQHFGVENHVWDAPQLNRWRLLQQNLMACSSAIRRRVLDSVSYSDVMRGGFEDWEFWVAACCEKDFVAAPLGEPVLRYRRWGYSMYSAASAKSGALIHRLRQNRPVYADGDRLERLKREDAPGFRVAARKAAPIAAAVATQTLRDVAVTAAAGAPVAVCSSEPARYFILSLDDQLLGDALHAHPTLVEQLALSFELTAPRAVWLHSGRRSIALAVPARWAQAVSALRGDDHTIVPVLERWLAQLPGGDVQRFQVGTPDRISARPDAIVPGARQWAWLAARTANRALVEIFGRERYEAAWNAVSLRRAVERWFPGSVQTTPSTGDARKQENWRWVAAEPLRWETSARRWQRFVVWDGRCDLEPLLEVAERGGAALLTTGALERAVPAHFRDVIAVDELARGSEIEALTLLLTRHRPAQLLIVRSRAACEALARVPAHCRPVAEAWFDGSSEAVPAALAANLLERLWVPDGARAAELTNRYYVSPTKLQLLSTETAVRPQLAVASGS